MTALIVTIDTEGDDLWRNPRDVGTKNARSLPRFQLLCEKYGVRPTYLANYEMVIDPYFIDFGREVIRSNTAEIGMHLHAWNSPPFYQLSCNDYLNQPYLIEYPDVVITKKISTITMMLEDRFQTKMVSHRAGRWAFNEFYAKKLIELGYEVDCSVTPGFSWKNHKGNPEGLGGSDYRNFPSHPYYIDPDDIKVPGRSSLLEVPMTIHNYVDPPFFRFLRLIRGASGIINKVRPVPGWLRPNGYNLKLMKNIIDQAVTLGAKHVEFMLHSSELMPGGSPYFPNIRSIEKLYSQMDNFFAYASSRCSSMTLKEYSKYFNDNYRQ